MVADIDACLDFARCLEEAMSKRGLNMHVSTLLRESMQQIFLWRNYKLEETKFVNIHMFRNSAWYATTLGQASGIICDKPFGRYATTLGPCEGIPETAVVCQLKDAEQQAMQISFTVKLF